MSHVLLSIHLHLSVLIRSFGTVSPITLLELRERWDCSGGWRRLSLCFLMCNCPAEDRVKYATATFEGPTFSWWNPTAQNMGLGEAHAMLWVDFVQRLKSEYCPREEVQKLEHEVWNYKMVGSEIEEYTVRRNELAVLCPDMHTPEYRRIEHYISGLVLEIAGLVAAGNLPTIAEVVRSAHQMTNLKVAEGVLPPKGAAE